MSEKYCSNCGAKLKPEADVCLKCGKSVGKSGRKGQSNKDPGIAALMSFIIPGAGQIYCGRIGRGLAFLFGTALGLVLLVIPGLLIYLFNIYDAYRLAQNAEK